MISITQRPSAKAIGKTSLFVSFEYDPKKVELVKSAENAIYHKDTHEWELPLSKLAYLIDSLTYLDDIELNLMSATNEEGLVSTITHKITPYDYQQEGVEWLINTKSGLLTDEPGLGKTIQVIYAAEELYEQKHIDHCLIICGINNLKQNWKKEIEKFSTLGCRVIGERINSKGKINYASVKERAEELYNYIEEFFVIINIESLRDSLVLDAIRDSENNFDMIVVDEIHKCGPTSSQGKNLLKLAKVGDYHYGLTGTLLVNSPLDAYAPLKFIGEEKASFSTFKQYYCNFEQKFGHFQITGYKNIDILRNEINECSLRRAKKDLLHLPPKIIVPEYIEMNTNQSKFYSDLQAGVIAEADRVNIKVTSLLGLITRLRQAATCPSVLSSTITESAKVDRAVSLVNEIASNGDKIVIFSTFKEPLYKLYDMLKDYNPLMCTGDQSEEEVSNNIDVFQQGLENKVMLCTTSKMGVGVTLTAANYEIFLDAPWTYAEFEQCCDRCYRIGTNKTVTIYNLIAKDTIDERIQYLLDTKKGISEYMIDDNANQTAELKMLLGITQPTWY